MTAPAGGGLEFLGWLRHMTETSLANHKPANLLGRNVGGSDWPRGARWTGLSEQRIRVAEAAFGAPFPPDYRLFVAQLHTLDRPMRTAHFVGSELQEGTGPSFTDWSHPAARLKEGEQWIVDGMLFDVEHNALWLPSWGVRPTAPADQLTVVTDVVRRYPKVLPIIGHRFLLAEPAKPGNPVLSIYQSDIITYASDLRTFLLTELAELLPASSPVRPVGDRRAIRGWDELLDR